MKVAVKSTKEVNLTKRVKTPQDLRFCPFVISANGRVKPDYVLIVGKEQRHPEGAYYLEWREGGERFRNPSDGTLAPPQQDATASNRWAVRLLDEDQDDGLLLATAVVGYLEN